MSGPVYGSVTRLLGSSVTVELSENIKMLSHSIWRLTVVVLGIRIRPRKREKIHEKVCGQETKLKVGEKSWKLFQ